MTVIPKKLSKKEHRLGSRRDSNPSVDRGDTGKLYMRENSPVFIFKKPYLMEPVGHSRRLRGQLDTRTYCTCSDSCSRHFGTPSSDIYLNHVVEQKYASYVQSCAITCNQQHLLAQYI